MSLRVRSYRPEQDRAAIEDLWARIFRDTRGG